MRQYVAYAKLITSTNRSRSDGTPLDGRHGISGLFESSSKSRKGWIGCQMIWECIPDI